MNNSNYQQNNGHRRRKTKRCPYCGEDILAHAKKCKHCGEWLINKYDDGHESSQEWSELWPHLAYIGGILCYAFAILDFALGILGIVDITGVSWTPPLFYLFGYLLQSLAKSSS